MCFHGSFASDKSDSETIQFLMHEIKDLKNDVSNLKIDVSNLKNENAQMKVIFASDTAMSHTVLVIDSPIYTIVTHKL